VKRWINDLEGNNVLLVSDLVGESCIDDDTIDVVLFKSVGEGNLGEFSVLVSLSLGLGG